MQLGREKWVWCENRSGRPTPLPLSPPAAGRRSANGAEDATGCLRTVRALALHDSQLGASAEPESSRMWQKWAAGAAARDTGDFEARMAERQSQGLDYVCHHTADWVGWHSHANGT